MSGTPNVCVDIFNHMSTLLTNFQSNVLNNGSTFSADSGFTTTSPSSSTPSQSIEETLNQWASMVMIGMLALFLMYSQYNSLSRQAIKPSRMSTGSHFGNGPDSVY